MPLNRRRETAGLLWAPSDPFLQEISMPIIRIEMLAGRSPQVKQQLAAEMTQTMARLCQCDPAHVYVMFSDIAHQDWAVAGALFAPPSAGSPEAVGRAS
jgi:4-oxalocrotonate tautomerase